jgi:tol-pal system protein YbgF
MKKFLITFFFISFISVASADETLNKILNELQILNKDLKTLEKAVYSKSFTANSAGTNTGIPSALEGALTRQLVKLSELEEQIQKITAGYEETLFKLQKISERVDKIQKDTELRFSEIGNQVPVANNAPSTKNLASAEKAKKPDVQKKDVQKKFPGTDKPQDFANTLNSSKPVVAEKQQIQTISPAAVVKTAEVEKPKLLPKGTPEKQYKFATSFIKVGDYEKAEIALKEFIETNPNHNLTGNAQYWFAETYYIRQLYHDAAAAYLDGYQKYPKSNKAPQNLLKLGITLAELGEKEQGCLMLTGLAKQYPKAEQSIIQKAKYETSKYKCKKS